MTCLLVIDGTNLLVRASHAMQSAQLSVGAINTGPTLSFVNMLSRYVKEVQPDQMAVCWDGGRSTYRLSVYADYKSDRAEPSGTKPKDRDIFRLTKDFLSLAGIHHVEQEGVEADDLVASYWRRHEGETVILSGDKDFLQLLDSNTAQIRPGGGDEWWTDARVLDKMGCRPEHLPYVMALTGDASDGVPGIPGFGTKTAVKYLAKHEWDLDALLAAGEKKLDGRESEVRRNLALVDLRNPITGIEVEEAPRFSPTTPENLMYLDLIEWLDHLQMNSIRRRLAEGSLWGDGWNQRLA